MSTDERSSRAGEYVLGTLSRPERVQFEAELGRSDLLQTEVCFWERHLEPLTDVLAWEKAPIGLWAAIEQRLDVQGRSAPSTDIGEISRLRRSVYVWRGATVGAASLATTLAIVLAIRSPSPEPKLAQTYLAVLDRGGQLPALIVRVDLKRSTVAVQTVSAQAPANRSLELWYIGADRKPLSLGVISNIATPRPLPAAIRTGIGNGEIAVSDEPTGGSPSGAPTGPVVYSGKLIEEGR